MSYHFPPENAPATLHPRFFAKYLPKFGIDVDVLACSFSPFDYEVPLPDANPVVTRTPLGADRDRMKEMHRWETFFGWHLKIPDWGRPWIPYGSAEGIRMVEEKKHDVMISFSPCFSTHRAALRIKQRFPDLPWFAYLADPFVGNPFLHANPVQNWLNRRIEAKVFGAADGVIANTERVEEMWRDRYPQYASKFFNIPNGFDWEEPVTAAPIPADRKTPVLLHAGNLYGGRFPKMLFESIERLTNAGKMSPSAMQIRLVGAVEPRSVPCPELLQSLIDKGIVVLDGFVSRAEALKRTGEADYLLVIDLNDSNTKFQVPSKLFDYLRVGRPILCYTPRGSETESILERAGVPMTIIAAEATADEADRGLLEFLRFSNESRPMSDWARQKFDAREMTAYLVSLFRGTVDPPASESLVGAGSINRP